MDLDDPSTILQFLASSFIMLAALWSMYVGYRLSSSFSGDLSRINDPNHVLAIVGNKIIGAILMVGGFLATTMMTVASLLLAAL